MKVVVREIKNTSTNIIQVKISPDTSIFISPRESLKDTDVYNLKDLKGLVEVKQDLSEVKPVMEGKQYLRG